MGKITAIVFDMDGVLIDAREWHYEALNRALELFGYTINRVEHLTTYDGLPTRKKLEMLSRERGLPAGLHSFINEVKQLYTQEIVHSKCKPTFAHEYALSRLKNMGYRIAVASNSVRASIELMMEKSDLRRYLDATISNQDVSKAKPDPEMYRTAAAKLGVTPKDCLVVEDNPNGIQSATAAGANVMVVQSPNDVYLENILEHLGRFDGVTRETPKADPLAATKDNTR